MTEEDGRVNNFRVSAASTPFLTRRGDRFAINWPRVSHGLPCHIKLKMKPFLAMKFLGMLSNTSLYGGLLISDDDYHSAAMGIGQNMLWLGALSFDVTSGQ